MLPGKWPTVGYKTQTIHGPEYRFKSPPLPTSLNCSIQGIYIYTKMTSVADADKADIQGDIWYDSRTIYAML